ncbi:uncharacterized protein LOC101242461 [Ciona intestinalis]
MPRRANERDFLISESSAMLTHSMGAVEWEGDEDEEEEENQRIFVLQDQGSTGSALMVLDVVLFLLDYVQMFALLQSLSLRWPWPYSWTTSFAFLFLFNLDIWEFAKLNSGSYIDARNGFVDSSAVAVNYRVMMLCWLIALIILTFSFFLMRWIFIHRLQSKKLNRLLKSLVVGMHVLALPIGVQIGKLFWCRPVSNVLDVDNTLVCWSAEHIVYVVISLLVAIVVFLVYPIWLAKVINTEVVTTGSKKHEAFMILKHCEQIFNLESSWNDRLFMSFASFRRFWVYYKPIHHVIKFLIVCFYAFLFNSRLVQASLIFAVFLLLLITYIIKRPYRVTSFNFPLWLGTLCLASSAVIGAMKNIPDIQSVFLLPSYMEGELVLINVAWIVGYLCWVIYFLLRLYGVIWPKMPLFPSMIPSDMRMLNRDTQRYMVAVIKARYSLRAATKVPALLAPVHELSHHIKVVNALACEAEYLHDPLQSSLRDVLDDLILLHTRLSPVSIFAETLKSYVQTTITRLTEVLPKFSRRLKQREFDLILVSPVRRRMLLKMFAVACFMSGKEGRSHTAGVRKLWSGSVSNLNDEGFHDDESVIVLEKIELKDKQESVEVYDREIGTSMC